MAAPTVVDVRGVCKTFGRNRRPVWRDLSFDIRRGEMVALIGASGSGKSTLIRALAGLVTIDRAAAADGPGAEEAGCIDLFGVTMQYGGRIAGSAGRLRARTGVIFQQFNLVPRLSVLTNVCLGLLGGMPGYRGWLGLFSQSEKQRAMAALSRVGMAEHALRRGAELSGGQQQRAAIARTLVQGAELIVADEPIASLDPASARRVMDILAELNRRDGITMLVSLHQVDYAFAYCPRTIALKDGGIVYDGHSRALSPALLDGIYGGAGEQAAPSPVTAPSAPRAVT
jgi:phosphonate transport system ATP-binding protein